MDRLHTLTLAASLLMVVALGGCDDTETTAKPRAGRVNAVVAKPPPAADKPTDFCDVYHAPTSAPRFEYPALTSAPKTSGKKGWRWINVWATWCKPCIEELPRLAKWTVQLGDKGMGDLILISSDETEEVVTKFRKKNPAAPPTTRLEDPAALVPWLETLGLSKESALPIHIFVDETGRARCIRAGGVSDAEYGAIERLLGS